MRVVVLGVGVMMPHLRLPQHKQRRMPRWQQICQSYPTMLVPERGPWWHTLMLFQMRRLC